MNDPLRTQGLYAEPTPPSERGRPRLYFPGLMRLYGPLAAPAETVLRVQQAPGGDPRITMFRTAPWALAIVDKVRSAQVEADNKCF